MATVESAATVAISRSPAGRAWGWLGRQAVNPVLVRDARSIFRGKRVFLLQLLYVAVLMVAMGIAAFALYEERNSGMGGSASLPDFGRWMFIGLFETQVALLMLVAVAHSAGAIAMEREKQTYDALALTSLTSAEVVLGKIASITSLCCLLMFTSLPLAAFSLFFGGVSPGEMALCYGMLALKIPFWAGLGVFASILVGRSIGAQVVALIAVGVENIVSVILMDPFSSGAGPSGGLFSPFMAPVMIADPSIDIRLLGWPMPGWLLPIPYALLLTGLLIVGAAEAMPHYRPKRSAALRTLLLAVSLFMAFLLTATYSGASHTGRGLGALVGIMVLVWMWAVALAPVFTSYPPDPGRENEGFSWSSVGPAQWLDRDARAGGGFSLLLWGVSLSGGFAALALALLSAHAPQWPSAPALLAALSISALSIIAYSAWGTVLAIVHRARREVVLATVLVILVLNSTAVIYGLGQAVMRRVPSTPALVLASPAAAASTILTYGDRGSVWSRYTPEQALVYGVGYSLLLLFGAYWYYNQRGKREPAEGIPYEAVTSERVSHDG